MQATSICSSCGYANTDPNAKFCPVCGGALVPTAKAGSTDPGLTFAEPGQEQQVPMQQAHPGPARSILPVKGFGNYANFYEGSRKIRGYLELTGQGIHFSKSKEVDFTVYYEDISSIGLGGRNMIEVTLVNGGLYRYKISYAGKWIRKIQELMENPDAITSNLVSAKSLRKSGGGLIAVGVIALIVFLFLYGNILLIVSAILCIVGGARNLKKAKEAEAEGL